MKDKIPLRTTTTPRLRVKLNKRCSESMGANFFLQRTQNELEQTEGHTMFLDTGFSFIKISMFSKPISKFYMILEFDKLILMVT